MVRLKPGIQIVEKKGLHYIVERGNRVVRFKPWLGDSVSFLYDFIMEKSIFPKKFGGDMQQHYDILRRTLAHAHGQRVLELATGSGSAVHFLNSDNRYVGTDISPGLLKRAAKRFTEAGFREPAFYVVSAEELPFDDALFDLCLCILSLNFFPNAERVLEEIARILVPEGVFVCSVPVPERNTLRRTIRGTLYSEKDLEQMCRARGLAFEPIPCDNGALMYFKAIKQPPRT